MEILFNNEASYQTGSFFSVRQESIKGDVITIVKVGNSKEPEKTMSYQLNQKEFKGMANLFSHLLKNPEYLLDLKSSSLLSEEAVIIE